MANFFQYKSPDFHLLEEYGFQRQNGVWQFATSIMEGQFDLTVSTRENGEVTTELIEREFGEPYTLHLVEDAAGEFVGRVREALGAVLQDIADRCFVKKIFRQEQTLALIEHVRARYGAETEHLWEKFPDCAIWRRADNQKWFGIIMTLPRKKLGLAGDEVVEILDVRAQPEELARMVDGKKYFPGWHMNKKHWLTVVLDGTLSNGEVFSLVEESYSLAKK